MTYVQKIMARFSKGFVLAFHDIPPERLEQLVDGIHPIQPIPLSELTRRWKAGKSTERLFAITIDDGVGETVRNLVPLFRARQWPATFFLPTAYLDTGRRFAFQWWRRVIPLLPRGPLELDSVKFDFSSPDAILKATERMEKLWHTARPEVYLPLTMKLASLAARSQGTTLDAIQPPAPVTWDEVASLSRDELIRFESHGVSHTALSALTEDEIAREMQHSRDRIAEHTGRPCRHLAYPFGSPQSIGTIAPRIARKYFDTAVTMSLGSVESADPWLLPRVPLYPENSAFFARLKILAKCTVLHHLRLENKPILTPALDTVSPLSSEPAGDRPR
jgi:peptidoglycan/xylan/chitin deacetylase (PgdA/CDA1 family)